jgi:hypothetical protein
VKFKAKRYATKLSKITVCAMAVALCCSLRPTESSTTPTAKSAPISMGDASKFVKEYYAALSRADIPAALGKFSERVNYREDRQRERAFIEKDLRKYVARWPILNLEPEAIAVSTEADGATTTGVNKIKFLAIHHDSVKDRFLETWEVNGKTQKYCDDFHGYSIFFHENATATESFAFASKLGQALLNAGLRSRCITSSRKTARSSRRKKASTPSTIWSCWKRPRCRPSCSNVASS